MLFPAFCRSPLSSGPAFRHAAGAGSPHPAGQAEPGLGSRRRRIRQGPPPTRTLGTDLVRADRPPRTRRLRIRRLRIRADRRRGKIRHALRGRPLIGRGNPPPPPLALEQRPDRGQLGPHALRAPTKGRDPPDRTRRRGTIRGAAEQRQWGLFEPQQAGWMLRTGPAQLASAGPRKSLRWGSNGSKRRDAPDRTRSRTEAPGPQALRTPAKGPDAPDRTRSRTEAPARSGAGRTLAGTPRRHRSRPCKRPATDPP